MDIACRILPMCDEPVATVVVTGGGELSFQEYFVRQRCKPRVTGFRFAGIERAAPCEAWFSSLGGGLILCPSNPFISIDPILGLPGVRTRLQRRDFPAVAVSPVVDGDAVKGPLAKMLRELGHSCDPVVIARHYSDFLDGIVIDSRDERFAPTLRKAGLRVAVCETLMTDREASRKVARVTLGLLADCRG
jgi:LPPG:FO 2-phospho-L-lactate transferase